MGTRFTLRSKGDLMAPGCCMSCGSGTRDEGYVDLNLYFEYHGSAYLCLVCLESASDVAGLLFGNKEQVQEVIDNANKISAEFERLTGEVQNRDERIARLMAVLSDELGVDSNPRPVVAVEDASPGSLAGGNGAPSALSGAGEPEVTEPTALKRRPAKAPKS